MNIGQKKVLSVFSFILGGLLIFLSLVEPSWGLFDRWRLRLIFGIALIGLGIFIRKGTKNEEK